MHRVYVQIYIYFWTRDVLSQGLTQELRSFKQLRGPDRAVKDNFRENEISVLYWASEAMPEFSFRS